MGKSKLFKDRLLVELWRAQQTKGLTSFLDAKAVADAAGLEYASGQLRLCVTEFRDYGYIKDAFTMGGGGPDGGLGFSMTQRGIETAEELEEELINDGEIDEIEETPAAKPQNSAPTAKPSTDKWEPLPLERTERLITIADQLEELTNDLKEDNGYAATEPDERNFIITSLQSGSKVLREQAVIYRMQFDAFIWEPLSRIASRFGSNAKGIAAAALKDALKDFFKDILKGNFDKFKDWFS